MVGRGSGDDDDGVMAIVPMQHNVSTNKPTIVITVSGSSKFYALALTLYEMIAADREPPAEKPGGTQPE